MRILVTGGKGALGRLLVPELLDRGHEVTVGTRSPRPRHDGATEVALDLRAATGLVETIAGHDVVVHLASSALRSAAVDVEGTRQLVAAAQGASIAHLVYVSIVGVDVHPYAYYRAKRAAEEVIETSGVPHTILRATQFHELAARLVEAQRHSPIVFVPSGVRFQSLDGAAVADRVVELIAAGPLGRAPDMGGPETHDLATMAREYLRATGRRRPVLRFPVPGATGAAFRRGDNLTPNRAVGSRGWTDYLDALPLRPELDAVGRALRLIGAVLLLTAGWMAVSPGSFFSELAAFGERNDHFIRDTATFTVPVGIALLAAARRVDWRRPVLAVTALQNGLHLLNHLSDIGGTDPGWHGPATAVVLGVFEVLLVRLYVIAGRSRPTLGAAPVPDRAASMAA